GQHRLARQALAVGAWAQAAVELGRYHDRLARHVFGQGAPEELLAGAVRIDVRGIEEIEAEVQRALEERLALGFGQRPGMVAAGGFAIAHAAQAEPRNLEAAAAESGVFHRQTPVSCRGRRRRGLALRSSTRTPMLPPSGASCAAPMPRRRHNPDIRSRRNGPRPHPKEIPCPSIRWPRPPCRTRFNRRKSISPPHCAWPCCTNSRKASTTISPSRCPASPTAT